MADNFSRLEERVEGLIQHLERVLRQNEQLRGRVAALEAELSEARERARQLENEIDQFRGQMQLSTDKEEQIRDRLKGILDKIDAIEAEVVAAESRD